MNKKGVHHARYLRYTLLVFIIFITLLFIKTEPTITGYVIYQEESQQYNWTFENPNDYTYDENIEIANNKAKLKKINYDFSDNLIAEYRFDEDAWINTSVEDSSPNNLHGAAYGDANSTEESIITRAGSFDGDGDYIQIERDGHPELDPAEAVTIMAWVKNTAQDDNYMTDIICRSGGSSGCSYRLYLNDDLSNDKLGVQVKTENGKQSHEWNWEGMNGEWIHFAMTFSGGTMTLYLNGENVSEWNNLGTALTYRTQYPSDNLYLGSDWNDNYFNGLIDEVAIYNTALTPAQINSIYNAQDDGRRNYQGYYSSNSLQTQDLTLTEPYETATFTTQHTNNIYFSHSSDSGQTWQPINDNTINLTDKEKIRILANFTSDGFTNPELTLISLDYTSRTCTENWSCTDWSPEICLPEEIQTRTCTDLHECVTEENKPLETQSCTCTPQLVNTSWSDWTDTEECQANDLKMQQKSLIQYDSNNCEENFTFIEQEYIACDYCSLRNCTNSFEDLISSDENNFIIIDALNKTNTLLEINTSNSVEAATVSIIEYNWTSQNNLPSEDIPANKYLEIESDIENINSVKIIVYYIDEEINTANIDENTLKIYYYNETNQEWEE